MKESFFELLKSAAMAGGSGGTPATLITKSITENGTYAASADNADGYSSVTVDVPTAPASAPMKDVNFYDYDGTIVYSYTQSEFAELDAMPENPVHDGLTAQGWNWSLSDAKTYVAAYKKLNIGQMYITSDGKTRLYITLTEGRTSPIMTLYLNANNEVDIDWGDGTAHETLTSTDAGYVSSERHNYASAGDYVIAITVVSGSASIQQSVQGANCVLGNGDSSLTTPNFAYISSITKVEIGSGINGLGQYAFHSFRSIKSITIPSGITSIGDYALNACSGLSVIIVPSTVTSIGNYSIYNCYALKTIALPYGLTNIGSNAFYYCYPLSIVTIPNTVTTIDSNAFRACQALPKITIPSSVTSIGNQAFGNCYSLSTITIDKAEGSISGSPWGAKTDAPTSTQIVWAG